MPDEFEERANNALKAGVPQIYFNGFVTQIGVGDIFLTTERNGQPIAIINMSYTVAKTLAVSLGGAIAQIEERAGRTILTTQDIETIFSDKNETKSR